MNKALEDKKERNLPNAFTKDLNTALNTASKTA